MITKRILVVDDEPSVTRNLKLNLESSDGYDVFAENHAANALTAARIFRPDLILLDVIMPGMDGGDVAARLRADRCSVTHRSSSSRRLSPTTKRTATRY